MATYTNTQMAVMAGEFNHVYAEHENVYSLGSTPDVGEAAHPDDWGDDHCPAGTVVTMTNSKGSTKVVKVEEDHWVLL